MCCCRQEIVLILEADRNFNDIIGFTKINITTSQFGQALPNITNSVDNIKIKTSLTNDSLDGGVSTYVLYSFDTSDISRAYPFKVEPRRRLYNKLNTNIISQVRIYMTDSINRPIGFSEVPVRSNSCNKISGQRMNQTNKYNRIK